MEFSDQIQASSRKKSGIGEPADNAGGWFDVSDHAAPKEVTTALALLDGTLRDNPNSRINGLHSAGTMDRWWTAVEKVIREALTDARTPITGNFNTEMSKALQHELSLHALEDYVPQQLINSPSAAGVASTQQERDHRQQQYERARNAVTAAIVRWVWHNALTSELRAEASNDMAHEWVLHGPMKTGTAYHYAAIKTYSTNPVNCIELDLLRGVFDRDLHGMMLAEHSQGRFGDMCRRLEETSVRLVRMLTNNAAFDPNVVAQMNTRVRNRTLRTTGASSPRARGPPQEVVGAPTAATRCSGSCAVVLRGGVS